MGALAPEVGPSDCSAPAEPHLRGASSGTAARLAQAIAPPGDSPAAKSASELLAAHHQAVGHAARRARRLFQLDVPDAPGLCFVGAEFDPAAFGPPGGLPALSASGKGTDADRALQGCVCEGVELLSQLVWGDEGFRSGAPEEPSGLAHDVLAGFLALLGLGTPWPSLRWIEALRLSDGAPAWIPAALCYRGVEPLDRVRPQVKLSSGSGAGPTARHALLHGLLELIECDAIALWWLGGMRGRRVPAALAAGGTAMIDALRRDAAGRRSWLLDITSDLAIPCIAALSVNEDGRALACGFAASMRCEDAIRGAILEMCQMELGLRVVALKANQGGEQALNAADLVHWRRAHALDARSCALLQPVERDTEIAAPGLEPRDPIGFLAAHLAARGIEAFAVDQTRADLGIPTVHVVAPALQPMPSPVITRRLERCIAQTGGGAGLTTGIALM